MKLAAPRTLWVSLLVSGALCSLAIGQAAAQGQWKTLPYPMPINPVHVALMNNGTVLIVAGSGNLPTNTNYQAAVWDPRADTIPRSRSHGTCFATEWWSYPTAVSSSTAATCATTPSSGSRGRGRSEEHTSELQSHHDLVCRLLLEKKKRSSMGLVMRWEHCTGGVLLAVR